MFKYLKVFRSARALAQVIVCVPFVLFSFYKLFGLTATDSPWKEEHLTNFIPSPVTATNNAKPAKHGKGIIPSILDPMHQFDISGPWASSKTIPKWMKDYFIWHKEQRRKGLTLDESNKYLIVLCLETDLKCGGLSDRLQPVPLYLLMASMTQRILLFYWDTPCSLEEYLVPPKGGLDWRVPEALRELQVLKVRDGKNYISNVRMAEDFMEGSNRNITRDHGLGGRNLESTQIVTIKIQHHDSGREAFNLLHGVDVAMNDSDIFNEVYHEVFRILFEPTAPMSLRISNTMSRLGLVPGQYTAAHMRARYPANQGPLGFRQTRQTLKEASTMDKVGNWTYQKFKKQAIEVATNAINCAYWLNPGVPIYFASDSNEIVNYIVKDSRFANNSIGVPVVGIVSSIEPLHLDMPDAKSKMCSDFYATFEDSWMLAQSSCLSYGMGGYGRFGAVLCFNASCTANHRNYKGQIERCPSIKQKRVPRYASNKVVSTQSREELGANKTNGEGVVDQRLSMKQFNSSQLLKMNGTWALSESIPEWMKQYFAWHREQRRRGLKLDDDTKYLVVSCLDGEERCGGLSDRLQPLPLYLLMAYATERILLIYWAKPCSLEEFLIPPRDGLDWRVPKEFERHITETYPSNLEIGKRLEAFLDGKIYLNTKVVLPIVQKWDGGRIAFNKWNGFTDEAKGGPYASLYHDMFRAVFEPTPPIAVRINTTMTKLGLLPGLYTGAHVRARYPAGSGPLGIRNIDGNKKTVNAHDKEGNWPFEQYKEKVVDIATNAINCAYGLHPGAPIFFASDSHETVQYIVEESSFTNNTMGFPVVGVVSPVEPLHLNTPFYKKYECPDFYAAFEDFWILGQSACISYGMGGYGRFASLVSYNVSCVAGHRNYKGMVQRCPAISKSSHS